MPGPDFRAPVAYATDTLDAWEASSAANSRQVDQAALSDDNVTALWNAARLHTDDVGEQAWLVAHCVMASKSAEWLGNRRVAFTTGERRLPGRPLGEPAPESAEYVGDPA